MKSFVLLAFATTLVTAHPQTVKKDMVFASDSSSSGKAFSEFSSSSKSFGAMKEQMDMGGSGMDMTKMFAGMGMPAMPDAGAGAVAGGGADAATSSGDSASAGDAAGDAGASGAATQGSCVEEGILGPIDAASVMKVMQGTKGEGAYITYATYNHYNRFAEILQGKPLASKDELGKLCLRSKPDAGGDGGEITDKWVGLDPEKTFTQTCKISKTALSATCTVNAEGSDNKDLKTYPSQFSVAWADNKSSVLVVICYNDGQKQWAVLSGEKTLPEDTKKTVLEKVGELGLDAKEPVDLSYDECKAA